MEIVYYYCSLDTFLNILKNREIYLSDPLKMNDKTELDWYLSLLNNLLHTNGDGIFCDVSGTTLNSIPDYFDTMDFAELSEMLHIKGQNSVYISCFSRNPDLLSQWRAYANDGKGVCIGMDLDALVKAHKADNLYYTSVKYQNAITINEIDSNMLSSINIMPSMLYDRSGGQTRKEQMEILLHEIIPVLVKYKNPAFQEEDEVRLIYGNELKLDKTVIEYFEPQRPWKEKILPHEFRTIGEDAITEFIKLSIDPKDLGINVVKSVYAGPKCRITVNDIKRLVMHYLGEAPEVKISEASYR